jgi:hypothetical protein
MLPLYERELRLLVPKSIAHKCDAISRGSLFGAELLVLPDSYHPPMFSWLKSSLAYAKVRWMECPESSFQALIHYATMLGVATLAPDFADTFPEIRNEMEIRRVKGVPLKVDWGLMRRAGYRRKAPEHFWRMAAESAPKKKAA